jgi:hypothetical protein
MKSRAIRFSRFPAGYGAAAILAMAGLARIACAADSEAGPLRAAPPDKSIAAMEISAREFSSIEKEVRKTQAEVDRLTRALARQETEEEVARERAREKAEWTERVAALKGELEKQIRATAKSQAEAAGLRTKLTESERTAKTQEAELGKLRKELEAARILVDKTAQEAAADRSQAEEALRRREAQWQEEGLVRKGKALREHLDGVRDASLAWSLNDAGLVMLAERRWDEAADLFRRALSILDSTVGRSNAAAGTVLQHVADAARAKGEHLVAEAHYREAAETFRSALGASHPRYAAALNGLACALRDLQRSADAEALYRQAIGIYKKNKPKEAVVLAIPLYNLGLLLMEQNRAGEAGPLLEEAARLAEKSRTTNHEAYLAIVRSLARYYRASGQMDKAAETEERALNVLVK